MLKLVWLFLGGLVVFCCLFIGLLVGGESLEDCLWVVVCFCFFLYRGGEGR